MSQYRSLPVPEGLDGLRLDAAIARLFGLSRSAAATLIDTGQATLDGKEPGRSDRVPAGAWLEVEIPDHPDAPPIAEPRAVEGMRLVHHDPDIVVIDKPPGVAAHPSPGWDGPTVTQGLAAAGIELARTGPAERQGVVHRLDVGTSGLMVLACSERAYTQLKDAFKERTVDKVYRALAQGHPDPSRGTVDAPIGRHPGSDWKFAVVAGGKPSVTHYRTLEAFRAASLLEVELETGRTHQIRVHLSALKHPCIGDLTYGADPVLAERLGVTRQWLHAARLGFDHPADGRRVDFESPDPVDLAPALELLAA